MKFGDYFNPLDNGCYQLQDLTLKKGISIFIYITRQDLSTCMLYVGFTIRPLA